MKRFTETAKWDDKWYRSLSPEAKLLRDFIVDKCDAVGIWEPDLESASFFIGTKITQKHIEEISDRLQLLPSGKYLVRRFVWFQYGELSDKCPPHKTVLRLIHQNGLVRQGLDYIHANGTSVPPMPETTLPEPESAYHPDARSVLHLLNQHTGRSFRELDSNLTPISARLSEPGVDLEGVRKMIGRQCKRWIGTKFEQYLQPSTLFAKTKFDEYYAARDLPVQNETNPSNAEKRVDRSIGTANEGTAHLYEGLGRMAKT